MNPLFLELENFMNHRKSSIDCSGFQSALIVAKQKDNDWESNGIGKTTIFSAIEYALFGEAPTSKLEKIVRDGESKCTVRFEFSLAGEVYLIERKRARSGRADVFLRKKGPTGWEKLSGTRGSEVEKTISELIKLSHKAFSNAIKFGQADLSGLAASKSSDDRRKILQEPMQLGEYVKLHKVAVEKRKIIKREIDNVDGAVQTIGDPSAIILAAELDLKQSSERILGKEASCQSLLGRLKDAQNSLDEINRTLPLSDSETQSKIDTFVRRLKELKAQISAANERAQRSSVVVDETTKKCAKLRARKLEIIAQEEAFEKDALRSPQTILDEINKVSADELLGTRLLATFEAEYDQASKSVPDGNVCKHCFQTITEEHRARCEAEAAKILAEKAESIKRTNVNLVKCSNKKKKLQEEYDRSRVREKLLRDLEHEKKSNDSELVLLTKNCEEAESRLSAAAQEMRLAQDESVVVANSLSSLKSVEQSESSKKVTAIKNDINMFENGLETVRKELAEAQQRHGAAQHKLKSAIETAEKLKELEKKQKELRKKLKIHDLVVESFGPSGIPNFVILNVLGELIVESNQWLQKLRPDLEIDCDKNLEMSFRVSGKQKDYDQLSIGQRVYIALSMKLGFSRMIQRKLGIDIRFLLLDEVDSALDKAGVEALVEVIKKLQNDFKIFVITHNDNLKDKFSHTILVEGDGANGATSSVVTAW